MKITVKGNRAVLRGIRAYEKRSVERTKEELKGWADKTEAGANRDVPVDTGELQQSIRQGMDNEGLVQTVGTNVEYAPYVEFGTGTEVDVPSGLEDYAIQFKGSGIKEVNLPARPYLFNNARRNFIEMVERLRRRIGN